MNRERGRGQKTEKSNTFIERRIFVLVSYVFCVEREREREGGG